MSISAAAAVKQLSIAKLANTSMPSLLKLKQAATIAVVLILATLATLNIGASSVEALLLGGAKDEHITHKTIMQELSAIEPCVIGSTYSFLYPPSFLPTSSEALQRNCKNRTVSLACVKDSIKTRQLPALVKRGLSTFHQTRNRAMKRYCNNVQSDNSKKVISDFKCIVSNHFNDLKQIDMDLSSDFLTLFRQKNLGDLELKYICCIVHSYKKKYIAAATKSCPAAQSVAFELVDFDTSMICDDDEKLAEKCSKMKPLVPRAKYDGRPGTGSAILIMFMLATLGEDRTELVNSGMMM